MKFLIILITFLSLPAFAGRESGGGDPRAYEFVVFGKKIIAFLESNPAHLEIDLALLRKKLNNLEDSLDTKVPLVRVPQVDQIDDCTTGPKQGCTRADSSVDIAGKTWDFAQPDFKCTLTAQELFFPEIKTGRYRKAAEICRQLTKWQPIAKEYNDMNHDPKNVCNLNPSIASPGILDEKSGCVYDNPSIFHNGKWVRLAYGVFERDNPSTEKVGYGFCALQNPFFVQAGMTGGGCDDQTVSCSTRRAMQPLISLSARGEVVNLYSEGDGPLGSVDQIVCK